MLAPETTRYPLNVCFYFAGELDVTLVDKTRGLAGVAKGITREYVLAFSIVNENLSPYLDRNIARFTDGDVRLAT